VTDDDYEVLPLVEAELDDDAAYEEWASHPISAYLLELVGAHLEARDSDAITATCNVHRSSGVIEFFCADDARRADLDRWLVGEQLRSTGIQGRTHALPRPTRDQFNSMRAEATVRKRRTSRPAQPQRRTSRPALPADRSDKSGEKE